MISLCDSATARNSNSLAARYVEARGKYVGMRVEPPGAKNLNSSLLSEETHALVQKLVYSIRMCVCARCSSHVCTRVHTYIYPGNTFFYLSPSLSCRTEGLHCGEKLHNKRNGSSAQSSFYTCSALCAHSLCDLAGWLAMCLVPHQAQAQLRKFDFRPAAERHRAQSFPAT